MSLTLWITLAKQPPRACCQGTPSSATELAQPGALGGNFCLVPRILGRLQSLHFKGQSMAQGFAFSVNFMSHSCFETASEATNPSLELSKTDFMQLAPSVLLSNSFLPTLPSEGN